MSEAENKMVFTVNPDRITIGFMEDMETAQASGKFGAMIDVYAELFDVDRDMVRKMTLSEFRSVTEKIIKAVSVPNGNE